MTDLTKIYLTLGIIFMFFAMLLSGCEELTGNGDVSGETSKVELVSYNVKTTWEEPTKYSPNWNDPYDYVDKQREGFYHISHPDSRFEQYIITGTVRNIAGYKLDKITVTAKFYDSNNVFLDSKSTTVRDVPDTYTKDFTIYASKSSTDYFENVDSVKFEIKEA